MKEEKSIPHRIKIKPLFKHELTPVKFQKDLFHLFTGSGEWVPLSSRFKINEVRVSSTFKFKLLSYNVWGAPQDSDSPFFKFKQRSEAILDIIKMESPDVICLQEVSKEWAEKILENEYIRENYFSTDATSKRMENYFGLTQITLSKHPIVSSTVYGLPGYEVYSLLNTQIVLDNRIVSINNIHLHSSKEHTAFRIAQLETIFSILDEDESPLKIIAGDFNFGDGTRWKENSYLRNSYSDVWSSLRPTDPGYTEDSHINIMRYNFKKAHKQERFDRVLLNDDKSICHAYEIKRLGESPISEDSETWPSDHFGLSVQFSVLSKLTTPSLG